MPGNNGVEDGAVLCGIKLSFLTLFCVVFVHQLRGRLAVLLGGEQEEAVFRRVAVI